MRPMAFQANDPGPNPGGRTNQLINSRGVSNFDGQNGIHALLKSTNRGILCLSSPTLRSIRVLCEVGYIEELSYAKHATNPD